VANSGLPTFQTMINMAFDETAHEIPSVTGSTRASRVLQMNDRIAFTPGGPRLRSEVHVVAPGETLVVAATIETMIRSSRRVGRPDKANWITAAWLDMSGASVGSFSTRWKVPKEPHTQAKQLLYLFNGMEPANASTIVQPVLQWGDSGPDKDGINRTGPFWTVASWIVPAPDGQTYHTPHIRVNPGDTLVGLIALTDRSPAGCIYSCEFEGLPATKFLTPAIPELTWCVETLEAYELSGGMDPPYDLNSAAEYPAAKFTAFEAIDVSIGGPPSNVMWIATNYQTRFGEYTKVPSDSTGDIQIHYSADSPAAGPTV
jgi:hypothetical protein